MLSLGLTVINFLEQICMFLNLGAILPKIFHLLTASSNSCVP